MSAAEARKAGAPAAAEVVEPTIFELSRAGRRGFRVPEEKTAGSRPHGIPERFLRRDAADLPENAELAVIRHYTRLSVLNHHIERDMYPLGSCTMKYNPKLSEAAADLPGFRDLHPSAPEELVPGAVELLVRLQELIAAVTGIHSVSLQPAAGAHGELTCLLMARAYFRDRGEARHKVVVPDSAHGTNPASSTFAGFTTVEVPSDARGEVDFEKLTATVDRDTAVVMLTLPNTLGLFESRIRDIARVVHEAGALLYMDGANFNAIVGQLRPGDVPFDFFHLNLHKTFATPHGGGGPGAGPVGASPALAPYLPGPLPSRRADGSCFLDHERPRSIGRVHSWFGNFGILVRAYAYMLYHGSDGLREISEGAVLGANYLLSRLRGEYELPYPRHCMHEFVLSGSRQKALGVRTMDVAKRLLDFGFHPPTVYFPLIVEEALMIEPTESESIETLDRFAETMLRIAREARENPEIVKSAPHATPVRRVDEAQAARHPDLCWGGRCG
ncbi:MAG: aminomethyl-transferring glycine dehydrogenase subunit GcvPB [Candidatus Eiseniibacteriota bacterium]